MLIGSTVLAPEDIELKVLVESVLATFEMDGSLLGTSGDMRFSGMTECVIIGAGGILISTFCCASAPTIDSGELSAFCDVLLEPVAE